MSTFLSQQVIPCCRSPLFPWWHSLSKAVWSTARTQTPWKMELISINRSRQGSQIASIAFLFYNYYTSECDWYCTWQERGRHGTRKGSYTWGEWLQDSVSMLSYIYSLYDWVEAVSAAGIRPMISLDPYPVFGNRLLNNSHLTSVSWLCLLFSSVDFLAFGLKHDYSKLFLIGISDFIAIWGSTHHFDIWKKTYLCDSAPLKKRALHRETSSGFYALSMDYLWIFLSCA